MRENPTIFHGVTGTTAVQTTHRNRLGLKKRARRSDIDSEHLYDETAQKAALRPAIWRAQTTDLRVEQEVHHVAVLH